MKHLLTVKETAEYLRLAESTIYKMVSRRDIPFMKIGTRVIFDRDALSVWAKSHSVESAQIRSKEGDNAA